MAIEHVDNPGCVFALVHEPDPERVGVAFVSSRADGERWKPCCHGCLGAINQVAEHNPAAGWRVFHFPTVAISRDGVNIDFRVPGVASVDIRQRSHPLDHPLTDG